MVNHYKKGDFAVGPAGVVMFLQDTDTGVHYEHVSYYENGHGLCCGGGGLGGGVDRYKPLSTAKEFIMARGYAAMKARDQARADVVEHDKTFKIHEAALDALISAERAVQEVKAKSDG